jgi:hypothetical protein
MRKFVTWFLGFSLVVQLVHTINMLQIAHAQRISAANQELLVAVQGHYDGLTVMAVFVLISLALFVVLSRAVRKDLARAGRP